MHRFMVDYLRRQRRPRTLLDRGFFVNGTPRLIPWCRIFGHRPVVDGTDSPGRHVRWVVCDRCGVRPDPQGNLDPDRWSPGQNYSGPFRHDWPADSDAHFLAIKAGTDPGPWPATPTGAIGAQLIIGRSHSIGLEAKVGNAGSEHTLAGHIILGPLGALYVHTEQHGQWLQRRLNPMGYESRATGISVHHGSAYWKLWAKRDSWSRSDPRWQQGSFPVDPRDIVFGPARYHYGPVGDPVPGTVRMPHGDDHPVILQLTRVEHGRPRLRWRRRSWSVNCESPGGIPTKPGGHGRITGLAVDVSDSDVASDTWPAAAAAALAVRLTADRSRYGYRPEPTAA